MTDLELPLTAKIKRLDIYPNVYGDFLPKERNLRGANITTAQAVGGKLTNVILTNMLKKPLVQNAIQTIGKVLKPVVNTWAGYLEEGQQPEVYKEGWYLDQLLYSEGLADKEKETTVEFFMSYSDRTLGVCHLLTPKDKTVLTKPKSDILGGPIKKAVPNNSIKAIADGHMMVLGMQTLRHCPPAHHAGWWYCFRLGFTNLEPENFVS